MYIYQDILDAKKVLFCVIMGLFQFKRKNLSLVYKNLTSFFSQVFPGTPGFLNKNIIYSKTVIRYVQSLHNKIISLLFTS